MPPDLEPLSPGDLGDMRRRLLRILRALDPGDDAPQEDLAERINRLKRLGLIPESVADLMHLVRRFRNRAEYQDRNICGAEAHAIRSAWFAIEVWSAGLAAIAQPSPLGAQQW